MTTKERLVEQENGHELQTTFSTIEATRKERFDSKPWGKPTILKESVCRKN